MVRRERTDESSLILCSQAEFGIASSGACLDYCCHRKGQSALIALFLENNLATVITSTLCVSLLIMQSWNPMILC